MHSVGIFELFLSTWWPPTSLSTCPDDLHGLFVICLIQSILACTMIWVDIRATYAYYLFHLSVVKQIIHEILKIWLAHICPECLSWTQCDVFKNSEPSMWKVYLFHPVPPGGLFVLESALLCSYIIKRIICI